MITKKDFQDSAQSVELGLIALANFNTTTPRPQVEAGRNILQLVWFSIHWPVQLWTYYKIQAPVARWFWKNITIRFKRIFDKLWFALQVKTEWKYL